MSRTQVCVERDDAETVLAANHVRRIVRTCEIYRGFGKPALIFPETRNMIVVPICGFRIREWAAESTAQRVPAKLLCKLSAQRVGGILGP